MGLKRTSGEGVKGSGGLKRFGDGPNAQYMCLISEWVGRSGRISVSIVGSCVESISM